mmetsp:Transcript_25761/g.52737  ORF Transcript_25761/g.52737 Transcript_25761/m.52737 type:complete len:251 (+) Transcript_25761:717-1469(+)
MHAPGGIGGIAKYQQPGVVVAFQALPERRGRDQISVLLPGLQNDGPRSGEGCHFGIGGPIRSGNDHGISGSGRGEHALIDALLRAVPDHDFRGRVVRDALPPLEIGGDGLTERRGARHGGVACVPSPDRRDGGVQNRSGRREVRFADAETRNVDPFALQSLHLPEDLHRLGHLHGRHERIEGDFGLLLGRIQRGRETKVRSRGDDGGGRRRSGSDGGGGHGRERRGAGGQRSRSGRDRRHRDPHNVQRPY